MLKIARVVSLLALVGTIVPPLFLFWGWMDGAAMKSWMLGAAFAWFAATPFWMDRR